MPTCISQLINATWHFSYARNIVTTAQTAHHSYTSTVLLDKCCWLSWALPAPELLGSVANVHCSQVSELTGTVFRSAEVLLLKSPSLGIRMQIACFSLATMCQEVGKPDLQLSCSDSELDMAGIMSTFLI